MKRALKGFLSTILVMGALLAGTVFASALEIDLVVEGAEGQLYSEKVDVEIGQSAEEVFSEALGEGNFVGEVSEYGFFVNEIMGELHSYATDGAYWSLFADMGQGYEASMLGVSALSVGEETKGFMFHVSMNTGTPVLSYENGYIKLEKEVTTYDENWNEIKSILPVAGGSVEIGGTTYVADEKGYFKSELEEGIYTANVSKEGEDGYPEIFRIPLELEIANETFTKTLSEYELIEGSYENPVDPEKAVTIEFTLEVDEDSANDGIYVVDESGNVIRPQVEMDGVNAVVLAPYGGYAAGSYSLVIEGEVQSADGKQLGKGFRTDFDVE